MAWPNKCYNARQQVHKSSHYSANLYMYEFFHNNSLKNVYQTGVSAN